MPKVTQDGEVIECKDGVCTIKERKNKPVVIEEQKKEESAVIELTADKFDDFVKNAKKPVIVDFYAVWCQPCKQVKPTVDELAQEKNEWIFASIDVDKAPAIMTKCGVMAMPTFVIFKDGVQWGMFNGARSKELLVAEIEKIINAEKAMPRSKEADGQQMIMAIVNRNLDEIKKLIANGADVKGVLMEMPQGKFTALRVAINNGTEEIIDVLIAAGAVLDAEMEEALKKQMDMAENMAKAFKDCYEYAQEKIAALPAPIKQDVKISNPEELAQQFMMAMMNLTVLQQLIADGADVNVRFNLGKGELTPLCFAILLNNRAAVDMLISAGATFDGDLINEQGNKQSVKDAIKQQIEESNRGVVRGRERLAYALKKTAKSS